MEGVMYIGPEIKAPKHSPGQKVWGGGRRPGSPRPLSSCLPQAPGYSDTSSLQQTAGCSSDVTECQPGCLGPWERPRKLLQVQTQSGLGGGAGGRSGPDTRGA